MAQGKFRAGATLGPVARALPEAAAAAYGGTGTATDRLVLLAKPLRAGAGQYVYVPLAVVRLHDLPEDLRRQVQVAAGAGGQGAGAAAAGTNSDAPTPLPGQLQLHPVVPEGRRLRQLNGKPSIEFAGEGASGGALDHEYSQRRVLRLLMADEGGKAVCLDASGLQELIDVTDGAAAATETGAFYDTVLAAPQNADDDLPIVALLLQLISDPAGAFDQPKSPPEDAAPFTETTLLGDGRTAELGAHYYDVLLPLPENLMPAVAGKASRSPTYAVQASIDAAAGAKAEAGRGHGGLSALVGVVVASSAATALAAGDVGPATAFGLFAVLVGGLSLAMASIHGV